MAKKGMEVAAVDLSKYAVRVGGDDVNAVTEAIRENLGGAELTPFDLDRIKIPTGGSTTWEIPTLDGDTDPKKSLDGVIVFQKNTRVFWKERYGGTEAVPPDCSSSDGKFGVGDPGGDCSTCPYAQFGSKDGGKGQACQLRNMVFMLGEGDVVPYCVSLPPTSLKSFRRFLFSLAKQGIKYWEVIISLKLVAKQGPAGPYSEVVPSLIGRLGAEDAKFMADYSAKMKPLFLSVSESDMAQTGGAVGQE